MKSSTTSASTSLTARSRHHPIRLAWIFRTNLPPRRGMPLSSNMQKRNFFGIGEIMSVLANPGETLKSLAEARKSLEEVRQEIQESKERAQLRTTHTFVPLPQFFPRPAEIRALEHILQGTPAFTILCGASSVGKTALLREVLSRDTYHVLHFDLRIAGFTDLASLYLSMSNQMEQYFDSLSKVQEGFEEFEKESWSFKHDRLSVERLIDKNGLDVVKSSDIARLMELFQSSLLHYWEFTPKLSKSDAATSSDETKVGRSTTKDFDNRTPQLSNSSADKNLREGDMHSKRTPVIFFDEAHKLNELIPSADVIKTLLDAMLVITKQDRLCHVVHATSDCFYLNWLRQLNIMTHCKVIAIGDCSKLETRTHFFDRLLPIVPEELKNKLDFESLFDAFGGKLVHWGDYVNDFVNAGGNLPVNKSSHFVQAYSSLNLQLLHASDSEEPELEERQSVDGGLSPNPRSLRTHTPFPVETIGDNTMNIRETQPLRPALSVFLAFQLLEVMRRLTEPGVFCISYFALCREFGIRAVDGMVRAKLLELRWVDTVTAEWNLESTHIQDSVLESEADKTSRADKHANTIGPKLSVSTPIMRYAMREVLKEYEVPRESDPQHRVSAMLGDDRSDYASLSDIDEY